MADRHQQKPYPLRMPDDLRERLESAASQLGRSLHAEIVSRLEATFDTVQARIARNRREEIQLLNVEIAKKVERLHDLSTGKASPDIQDEIRRLRGELDSLRYVLEHATFEAAMMEGRVPFEPAHNDDHYVSPSSKKA